MAALAGSQWRDFPNESTGNQFFSTEQFNAHAELGKAMMKDAVEAIKHENDMDMQVHYSYDDHMDGFSDERKMQVFKCRSKNKAWAHASVPGDGNCGPASLSLRVKIWVASYLRLEESVGRSVKIKLNSSCDFHGHLINIHAFSELKTKLKEAGNGHFSQQFRVL